MPSLLGRLFPGVENIDTESLSNSLRSTSTNPGSLARMRGFEARKTQAAKAQIDEQVRIDEAVLETKKGILAKVFDEMKHLDGPERIRAEAAASRLMANIGMAPETHEAVFQTIPRGQPRKEEVAAQAAATEANIEDATPESREAFIKSSRTEDLEFAEGDPFEDVPLSALKRLFSSATPESTRKAIASGDLDSLEFEEDDERDIRSIGGMIVDVTDPAKPVILIESRTGGGTNLSKAEEELEKLEAALAKDPGDERLVEKVGRAKANVNRIATGQQQVEGDFSAVATISRDLIQDVRDIIVEAGEAGDTVTGPIGFSKSEFGGLGRMAGLPVSLRSEMLRRRLATLQTQIGPRLLQEKRLSNDERARIKEIVGDQSLFNDDQSILQAMLDLESILDRLQGKDSKARLLQESGSNPEISNEELLQRGRSILQGGPS